MRDYIIVSAVNQSNEALEYLEQSSPILMFVDHIAMVCEAETEMGMVTIITTKTGDDHMIEESFQEVTEMIHDKIKQERDKNYIFIN